MEKLRNKLKKNGTEDQKKEFKTLEGLYETELEKLEEAKSKKEEEEHSKISEMLSSDNDTPLKEQIESEMEELY